MGPIKLDGHLLGSIGMVNINAPFTDGQIFLVKHLTEYIRIIFQNLNGEMVQDDCYYFFRLLNGYEIEAHSVAFHLRNLGWNIQDSFYLLTFEFHKDLGEFAPEEAIISRLLNHYPKTFSCSYEGAIIQIMKKDDYDITKPEIQKQLEHFCCNNYLRCGISDCFDDFMNVKYYYIQSKCALSNNEKPGDYSVHFFSQNYISHVLHTLDQATSLTALCHPKLLSLYNSDQKNRQELLECIYTYLLSGRNIADTARKLYVHRNTLLYRLQIVSQHLGINLDELDEDQTFQMLIFCMIIRTKF